MNPEVEESRDDNRTRYRESRHTNRFRFKDKSRRTADEDCNSSENSSAKRGAKSDDDGHTNKRSRQHRKSRHSSKPHNSKSSTPYDPVHSNNLPRDYLDPEVAFRESLFDAMADDEGAQFWEGVYGQPIHTYPNTKLSPDGELERMSDEEYAAYVRAKMYEKTHQYRAEEKARRDMARKKKEAMRKEREASARGIFDNAAKQGEQNFRSASRQKIEDDAFQREIKESIKRGAERNKMKAWSEIWNKYLAQWENLERGISESLSMESIPWPVAGRKYNDADSKNIERFFRYAPSAGGSNDEQLAKILKVERIRWHPDKIQHKLGGQDISKDVLQAVTAIFQIIDQLWLKIRHSS